MTEPQQNVGGGGGGINFKISERNYLVVSPEREGEERGTYYGELAHRIKKAEKSSPTVSSSHL